MEKESALTIGMSDNLKDDYENYQNYLETKRDIKSIPKESFGYEAWIALDSLAVDPDGQRTMMESQVQEIISDFKPQAFGRLTVAKRDNSGVYYIQNGQHRAEALKRLGFKEAPCVVVLSNSIKDEADNFLKINENSAVVSNIDKYRIGVSAGVESWLRVKEVIDYAGLTVGTNPKYNLSAIASVNRFINSPVLESSRQAKMNTMKTALYILKEVITIEYIVQNAILSMCIFVREYIDTEIITRDQAIEAFKDIDMNGLIKVAQTMKNSATRGKVISYLAWLFYSEYNKKVKGRDRLPARIEP